MSQEAIDEWLEDSVFWFTFLGWPPVGISVHRHEEYAMREFYELQIAQ